MEISKSQQRKDLTEFMEWTLLELIADCIDYEILRTGYKSSTCKRSRYHITPTQSSKFSTWYHMSHSGHTNFKCKILDLLITR